jgi:hypothetical protein
LHTAWFLNTAWLLGCLPEARAFAGATRHVAEAQGRLLADLLHRNRDTEFGQLHQFTRIAGPHDFQQRVPLSRHEDYAAAIERIAACRQGVLTRDPVELFEPTSGSSGGAKLIPYTAGLRRQFQRAVAAWMADLFLGRPALRHGRAYWSISPALAEERHTAAGIRIGFDSDAAYLGTATRWLLRHLLAVPGEVAAAADIERFRHETLRHLLAARDLALVSIWSPTFLTTLLAALEPRHEEICLDLRRAGMARRADEIVAILRAADPMPAKLRRLWPRLTLISCWADAAAARYVPALQDLFPHVEIQPKGLLATEGCVSFPLIGRSGAALALRSGFFEFQELTSPERLHLAHQLDGGGRYRVVLTTAGGLYRYQLRDEVEVVGFEKQCPLLRFLGRADGGSDLVGEKLSEQQVRELLEQLLRGREMSTTFAMLAPVHACPPRYRLYLEGSVSAGDSAAVRRLADDLEAGLCANPHYAYARRLGQLAAAEVTVLESRGAAWEAYQQACVARGMTVGNIKPAALDAASDWVEIFAPLCR